MTDLRPRRSVLYMPGSNARALVKARTLPADALILDLEDSVAPEQKDEARRLVCAALGDGFGARETVVRINALESLWGEADVAAVAAAGPDAVLVPKVTGPDDLVAIGRRLRRHGAPERTRVWAMIETPLAILDPKAIAGTALDVDTRLACFVMGTNDLAKETRTRLVPGRAPMLPWLMAALTAARAYGLDIIDGVYNALSDADGLRAECEQARDLGFDGKSLIHPDQIAAANTIFTPSEAELEAARAIIDAFGRPENAGRAVIGLDGRMVERLHASMAERLVALAAAIRARA